MLSREASSTRKTSLIRAVALISAALLALCLSGCSAGGPVRLLGANYFVYADGGYGSVSDPYLCVNWQNESDRAIDYMELTVECIDENGVRMTDGEKDSFDVRLMESQGVQPGQMNTQNIIEVPFKFDSEPSKVAVRVNRISYSDGSTWTNDDEGFHEFKAGENETSEIPVVIDEVNFYESSPQATDRYINIDWHNASPEATTLAVEFKITGYGTSSSASEANPVTYLTLSDGVSPGGENYQWKSQFSNRFSGDINEASYYSICVHRVIDTDGNVWINEMDEGSVSSAFLGKKGCAFGDFSNYPQVNELIKSLNVRLDSYGFAYGSPEVFVKAGSHCLIRYPNLDVTVKVNSDGTLVDDWVSYNMYFEPTDAGIEKAQEEYGDLGLCVLLSVLTRIDEQSLKTSWEDAIYVTGEKSLSIDDRLFQIESKGGRVYDDSGDLIGVVGVCVAVDTTGAFDHDWAKHYPY